MTTVSGASPSTRGIISRPVMPSIVRSLKTRSNFSLPMSLSAFSAESVSAHS
jgi:hypothetical protein